MLVMEEERMKGEDEKIIMIAGSEIAELPAGKSDFAAINSKSEDSNRNDDHGVSPSTKKISSAENKGKSCKGFLYYTSNFQANSQNPLCVGLSRSLPNESKVHTYDKGRSLMDFRYGCIGYSLYKDQKDKSSKGQQTPTELPVCLGLEILVDRRLKAADSASSPHILNKEDENRKPQHRSPKPTNATGEEFLSRFSRNAYLVANGVAKNIRRVGNQIKQSLDDILYPYRRRPK